MSEQEVNSPMPGIDDRVTPRTDDRPARLLQAGRSDFHVHSTVSGDTARDATLENIIAVARGLGMREIGITDHVLARGDEKNSLPARPDDEASHRALCRAIRATRSPVKVYASWEVDYFDGGTFGGRYSFDPERHLRELDYVLLAHHAMNHVIDGSIEFLGRYLVRIMMEMAREPYANIIAHPFYARADKHGAILASISDGAISEVFHAIRENGKAAEITSYQFNADLRDVDQMRRVYSVARSTGVKFTLDSDAHSLWDMAEGLRCSYVLAELGFTDDDFVDYDGLIGLKRGVSADRSHG